MPEGDTVWQTARRLHTALAGQVLTRSDLRVPRYATADLTGRTVLDVTPRGKHLLTRIEGGLTLHSHLRMDGSWKVYAPGERWSGGPGHQIRADPRHRRPHGRRATASPYWNCSAPPTRTEPSATSAPTSSARTGTPTRPWRTSCATRPAPSARPSSTSATSPASATSTRASSASSSASPPGSPSATSPPTHAARLPALAKKLLEANRDRPARSTTAPPRPEPLRVRPRTPPLSALPHPDPRGRPGRRLPRAPHLLVPDLPTGPAPRPTPPSPPPARPAHPRPRNPQTARTTN